ncbi:MAG: acetyl-CoA carboxylase biotin carboxyl carrier protein [Calditrichia bacterium]|nr:acetyl-CoA carboxylase biotin carboxyl carrier protein [Calditrichia bacterium]
MDIKEIKALLKLMEQSEIDEIEIEEDNKKIRISKNLPGNKPVEQTQSFIMPPAGFPTMAPHAAYMPEVSAEPAEEPEKKYNGNVVEVKAPMVGTFYRAPAPDAPHYVEIGDDVKAGQTLCIIEAMKLMNEIESDFKGKIVDVLVENAEPVEFGKVLFIIEKH